MYTRHLRLAALILIAVFNRHAYSQENNSGSVPGNDHPILWTDPGDIGSRNLLWGPGGEERQPKLPVEFVQEDRAGTSPKFDVNDSEGKKWRAKLGLESKPETAATRLLWAVGYTANENYFFPELEVKNMPASLSRGQNLAGKNGRVPNVRLQRHPHGYKRKGNWSWRHNPFYGTREFNGLRVMMGLIANWDLKDDNNAVLESEKDSGGEVYEVSDVGTAFGTAGKSFTNRASKGNLEAYRKTKLIAHIHEDEIDLNFPKSPPATEIAEFQWAFYAHQRSIQWMGKHIPRADAKWIGSLLAQLAPEQIQDAFKAAGYSPSEVAAFTEAVTSRIQELNGL